MSDVNDTSSMSSTRLMKHLKTIQTDKQELKNSLLKALEKMRCLDQLVRSLGAVSQDFTFTNRVSWGSVFAALGETSGSEAVTEETKLDYINDVLADTTAQVEQQLIPSLQQARNKWMLQIIGVELLLVMFLGALLAGITYLNGLWPVASVSFSVTDILYQRPLFTGLILGLLIISALALHFYLRNYFAIKVAGALAEESSEFDLAGAFLRNTRIRHSVFRPDIVGLGWSGRKCLAKSLTEADLHAASDPASDPASDSGRG